MSARAASRLASLGFTMVYRYQAGKADWFAAGLPREGRDANTPRVADRADRDVTTCHIDERIGDVHNRAGSASGEPVIVVDSDRVVLGVVASDALSGDSAKSVEDVIDSGPLTVRPDLPAGQIPEYSKRQRVPYAVVTTSDGVLIGLVNLRGSTS